MIEVGNLPRRLDSDPVYGRPDFGDRLSSGDLANGSGYLRSQRTRYGREYQRRRVQNQRSGTPARRTSRFHLPHLYAGPAPITHASGRSWLVLMWRACNRRLAPTPGAGARWWAVAGHQLTEPSLPTANVYAVDHGHREIIRT